MPGDGLGLALAREAIIAPLKGGHAFARPIAFRAADVGLRKVEFNQASALDAGVDGALIGVVAVGVDRAAVGGWIAVDALS